MGNVVRISLLNSGGAAETVSSALPASCHSCLHPVLVVDAKGRIADANEAALAFLNHARDTLKTMAAGDVVMRFDDVILDLVIKALPHGRPVVMDALCGRSDGVWIPCELVVIHSEGMDDDRIRIHLMIREGGKLSGQGNVVAGLEAKLARAERLEMAGVVAGQIAHDFNNLLTPLLAYPDLIRGEIKGSAEAIEYLDVIEKTAGDMSRLTQQLMTLGRRGRIGAERFCVNEVIGEVIKLLQPSLPKGVVIEFDQVTNLRDMTGSRDQVRRVVENLFQNAIDAMGDGGVVGVKTENVSLAFPLGSYGAVMPGEYVKVTVVDSGPGISEAIRDKIFDPFFTTKKATKQRGSGLGLSIVHGIVRDHKGYIDMESFPGRGDRNNFMKGWAWI